MWRSGAGGGKWLRARGRLKCEASSYKVQGGKVARLLAGGKANGGSGLVTNGPKCRKAAPLLRWTGMHGNATFIQACIHARACTVASDAFTGNGPMHGGWGGEYQCGPQTCRPVGGWRR